MRSSNSVCKIILRRGKIEEATAAALVTPANDSLVGNLQPLYWRFISRHSADSAVRQAAGPSLEQACLAIEPVQDPGSTGVRRDITRWTGGVKHGESAPVRCAAGSAVVTPAYGRLLADHVIHAVAPDSEFGYEGLYTGSLEDERLSSVARHSAALPVEGRHPSWQQFSPPDSLLLSAYRSAFEQAERVGATSVACPALGSGVKGWRHAVSAALGLEAAVGMVAAAGGGGAAGADGPPRVDAVHFVLGGDPYNPNTEKGWRDWTQTARTLLGAPPGLEGDDAAFDEAVRHGQPLEWELRRDDAAERWRPRWNAFSGTTTLPLMRVREMQEMARNRRLGVSGTDRALSREQELRAVKRRSTR